MIRLVKILFLLLIIPFAIKGQEIDENILLKNII